MNLSEHARLMDKIGKLEAEKEELIRLLKANTSKSVLRRWTHQTNIKELWPDGEVEEA